MDCWTCLQGELIPTNHAGLVVTHPYLVFLCVGKGDDALQ